MSLLDRAKILNQRLADVSLVQDLLDQEKHAIEAELVNIRIKQLIQETE